MLKVGSRVKFVSDTGSGVIRSIQGNIASVDVDGFEIPALLSDIVEVAIEDENAAIVKIGPSDPKPTKGTFQKSGKSTKVNQRATTQYGKIALSADWEDDEPVDVLTLKRNYIKSQKTETVEIQEPKIVVKPTKAPFELTSYDIKLMFVPTDKAVKAEQSDLQAYLVNDSSYEVYYNVAQWHSGHVVTIGYGKLDADTKEPIKKFTRNDLSQIITLHVSLLPFKPVSFVPQSVENFDIELHPLKFVRSGNYMANDYFEEPAILFTLASSNPESKPQGSEPSVKELLQQSVSAIKPKREDIKRSPATDMKNEPEIIDLHADEILESTAAMAPAEILTSQLSRFTIALDGAIKSGRSGKIVFIHGIGKGKLKYEMKKILDRQYSKLRYQDASFAEYGYGAIMVFLKQQ